jgi:hypothetical protein
MIAAPIPSMTYRETRSVGTLLAQPARGLVADLPPDRRPAQHSDQSPGCGDTRTQGHDATAADLATRYEERSTLAFLGDLVSALPGKLEER